MAGVPVIAAPTDEEANRLATSPKQRFLKLIRGEPIFTVPPVDSMDGLWNEAEREIVEGKFAAAIVGGPRHCETQIRDIPRRHRRRRSHALDRRLPPR